MIYLRLFLEFFKIGLFTFGGGYAMIPLIKEVVINNSWMDEATFYSFIGVCESTPGPIAINMATFVGMSCNGVLGAIIATLGVTLPSFIIIILVASILKRMLDNKYVNAFFNGVKPIIISLILTTGIILLFKSLGYVSLSEFNFNIKSFIILIILLIIMLFYKLCFKKSINTILFILISAGIGILINII
ncbi:MAG: chromate transporter [Candidatus Caccosoma sp.]|nr:chromate transporter [Candidatus Caccosoma sp.]